MQSTSFAYDSFLVHKIQLLASKSRHGVRRIFALAKTRFIDIATIRITQNRLPIGTQPAVGARIE